MKSRQTVSIEDKRQETLKKAFDKALPKLNKVAQLNDEAIPSSIDLRNRHTIILTPDVKALIIAYALVDLVEISAQSAAASYDPKSGQALADYNYIMSNIINRAIHELHKDGLFD